MRKLVAILCLSIMFLFVGCSSIRTETAIQVYGTPVRLEYTNYHSAIIYFVSGEPLYLYSDNAIVWEDFLVLEEQYKFTITVRNKTQFNVISMEKQ